VGREALGISRAAMDSALLDLASRRGAAVLERTEALEPLIEDGRVAGARLRGVGESGDGRPVRARLVVGADGRRSMLQRALAPGSGVPLRSGPRSWFGLKVHLEGDAARVGTRVELHLYDGGYAGLGAIEGGRLNLCLLARVDALRACGGSPDRLLSERLVKNPLLRARLDGARPSGPWTTVGPLRFGVRRPALAGALLLGDAAGTIDPFSGEGMSNALAGAELALPWVLAALAAGGLGDERAQGWERAFRASFSGVTRRVRALGRLFERPALGEPALAALAALGPSRVLPRLVAGTRTGVPAGPAEPAARLS
jgi:flavin-dependent dehydrogenase